MDRDNSIAGEDETTQGLHRHCIACVSAPTVASVESRYANVNTQTNTQTSECRGNQNNANIDIILYYLSTVQIL